MEEIKLPFKALAQEAGISVDQAKYWCRLLRIKPTVSNHIKYLSAEDAKKLKDMVPLVNAGMAPKNAAGLLAPETAIVRNTESVDETTQSVDMVKIMAGQNEIKNAVLAIAETFKAELTRVADENLLLARQNQRLLEEIRLLRG
ncbi:MAG: hypothetical protein HQM09_25275, partial [Candidatus Riflebacteria bacterium]|nr:hypothetical protein [Candidatus Riflebacteria bacterium]